MTYLQFGCGRHGIDGWLNFDASPTLRFERIPVIGRLYTKNDRRFPSNVLYGNIAKGLPIPSDHCAGIFSEHVLEHLALADFELALHHSYRHLRPGGIFRFTVPDLEIMIERYHRNGDAADFIRSTGMGMEQAVSGVMGHLVALLGHSAHRWLWDRKAITARLAAHGFVRIRAANFGDSDDPRFAEVEHEDRFVDSVGIECRKAH